MPSVGLVLGAGGIVGAAWHAGTLAALADKGWDARTASLTVGTSAGSGMSAALRAGLDPHDLRAGATGRPMSRAGQAYADRAGPPPDIPSPEFGGRLPRPQAPTLAMRASAPWSFRPFTAFAAAMPEGRIPTSMIGDRIRRTRDTPWPDEPTWICAVRLSDGRRVVFGRDDVDAGHLATAVEASSAIPGFFMPVEIDGERYVDGGIHSPTNADLAGGLGFDVVIVSSPMSATTNALYRPTVNGGRALHAARLRREVQTVRRGGTPVLVLQPGPRVVDLAGLNAMDPTRRGDVADLAFETVRAHLDTVAVADRVDLLLA